MRLTPWTALTSLLATVVLAGPAVAAQTPATPPGPSVEMADEAGFDERDFAVAQGQLPGTLSLPAGTGPFPAVVLVHGSGPNDRDQTLGPNRPFRDLAHGLAGHGIAVLRYDKRTRVRPGDFAGNDFTVEHEVIADAVAAVEAIAADPAVDPGRVFVLGHSLGALLAPRIAQRAALAGTVLVAAPARPLEDLVIEQMEYILGLDPDNLARNESRMAQLREQRDVVRTLDDPEATGLMLGLPASYWMDLSSYDAVATAAALDVPILLLHGGRDYQVTDTDFALWQQGLAGHAGATLVRHAELNHLMMAGDGRSTPTEYLRRSDVDPGLIAQVAEWILQQPPAAGEGR